VDLKDATLMILTESGDHVGLARLAQSAYDELASGREVPYPVLGDMLSEASGKGVLSALRHKYSAVACEAVLMPICAEIGRQKPARPRRRPVPSDSSPDPLTDASFARPRRRPVPSDSSPDPLTADIDYVR
jgi:hypothetical protein